MGREPVPGALSGTPLPCLRSWRGLLAAPLLLLALAAVACGGGGGSEGRPAATQSAPAETSAAGTSASGRAATATPAPSPSPTATPRRGPTDRGQVIDAATKAVGARHISPLTRAACVEDNPRELPCIELLSDAPSLDGGLARFNGGYLSGNRFELFLGRAADGSWGYWYSTQQPSYTVTELPAAVLTCGGGQGVTVREGPSAGAKAVTRLPDLAELRAEEFVLTAAGAAPATRGDGWYRVTGAASGWVPSRDAVAARFGDCAFRDEIEGTAPHG